ncbi:MAG: hypothetical protein R6V54_01405 [Desulfobacteraceae bacterium]
MTIGVIWIKSQGGIWDRYRPVYFDEFMSSRKHRIKYWQEKMDFNRELEKAGPNRGQIARGVALKRS